MSPFDLARLGGEPEGLRCNAEKAHRLVPVKPWLFAVWRRPEDRDLMMRPVRGDPFACPSIATAGHQSIAVEDAGNQIIIGDEHQLADGRDDVAGRAVALNPVNAIGPLHVDVPPFALQQSHGRAGAIAHTRRADVLDPSLDAGLVAAAGLVG
ncbi:hypothetical protein MEA186_31721 [Mesorhizobium amorphae CCNWGS0123]|uniref:Uncharacterized protein n=1 Tax=Mesorhizobium amorphae CCNWGS0123 TaxID=1082933 RepID=G6YK10_9HYPH|nr:hypothetical protein A6B35_31890 [Mesorhizobium amorphae CCNWGS0123]EHH04182.1 hypothetical protein MEA186_31721 [Mesorhizobium amorphae CCNWGS0123]